MDNHLEFKFKMLSHASILSHVYESRAVRIIRKLLCCLKQTNQKKKKKKHLDGPVDLSTSSILAFTTILD